MSVTVARYAPFWPHERKAFLPCASDVAYAFELMEPGQFSFRLPVNSSQLVHEGDLIGISSSHGLPDYAGVVEKTLASEGGAHVEIVGQELTSLLKARITRQETVYTSGTYGRIAAEIVQVANARNPTSIVVRPAKHSEAIPTSFTVRSGPVLDALTDLAELTGWEWQAIYRCDVTLSASLVLAQRAGFDLRRTYRLAGRQIANATHDRDIINDAQLVQLVGDAGDFGDRPSAAAIVDARGRLQDIAQTVVSVSDGNVRRPQRRSIATARETALTRLDFSDSLTVQRKAMQTIRQAVGGLETIEVEATTEADWSKLRVGNIVSVVLSMAEYAAGVEAVWRILGIQPDHDTGICRLIGRVLPDG